MSPEDNLDPLKPEPDIADKNPPAVGKEKTPTLEDILSRVHQGVEERKFQGELPLSISIGNQTVFKATPGQEPSKNTITADQVALIHKAIQDPQGLSGSLRISVGKEKILHIKDGEVVADKFGLVPEQARTQQTTQQVQNKPTQAEAPQSLTEQVKALQETVERQQKQIDLLSERLDKFSNSPVFMVVADEKVSSWLNNLHSKIQSAGQEAVKQVSESLEQNKTSLLAKAQRLVSNIKENITDTLQAARNTIQTKASEVALGAMTAATTNLASVVGEKLPDGTVVMENRNSNQRLEVNGSTVALKERPQVDHQALWDKYSENLPADRPVVRTKLAVINAMQDGQTRATVHDMLSAADPHFGKIRNEYGLDRAVAYVKQMTRAAERLDQSMGPAPTVTQQQQRNQSNGLQQ